MPLSVGSNSTGPANLQARVRLLQDLREQSMRFLHPKLKLGSQSGDDRSSGQTFRNLALLSAFDIFPHVLLRTQTPGIRTRSGVCCSNAGDCR